MSLESYRLLSERADIGYANFFLLVTFGVLLLGLLWRVPRAQHYLSKYGVYLGALPLLAVHPLLALSSVGATFTAGRNWRWRGAVPDWLVLVSVASVTRFPRLFDSFWYDETFTARIASLPLGNLPAAIMGDVHPPLYYLIEWFTANTLGTTEAALRLPSYVFGVALVWLIYELVKALGLNATTALVAGLIVAVLPASIRYSNEARGYALFACLALVMAIAILRNRPRWFVAAAVAICYTHNLGFFYVAVLGLTALLYRRNGRWFRGVVAAGVGAGAWLPFAVQQSADITDGFWLDFNLPRILQLPTMMTAFEISDQLIPFVYVPIIAATLISLYAGRKWIVSGRGFVWAALVFGVPVSVAVASVMWRPVYLDRALLPCALALVIAWAYALTHAAPFAARAGRMALVPALLLANIHYFSAEGAKEPIDQFLSRCADTDSVYTSSVAAAIYAAHYTDQPLTLWTEANDLNQSLNDAAKAAMQFTQGTLEDLRGTVCYFHTVTPLSSLDEQQHVQSILTTIPQSERYSYEVNRLLTVFIDVLEIR